MVGSFLKGGSLMQWKSLHEKALLASQKFKHSEAELLAALVEIDTHRVFEKFGVTSTYSYCLKILRLSEDQAYAFVKVARLSQQMPALQAAVESGRVNVSTLRKIAPVIKPENQSEWLAKAEALPRRVLEQEVARHAPQSLAQDRLKPLSAESTGLTCALDSETAELLRRVQDLLSQKKKKPVGLGETLKTVLQDWQQRQDPVVRAQKIKAKADSRRETTAGAKAENTTKTQSDRKRIPLPAKLEQAVQLRDQGQCTFEHFHHGRRQGRRWFEIHHKVPVSQGGENTLSNLQTLCSAHHRMGHKFTSGT